MPTRASGRAPKSTPNSSALTLTLTLSPTPTPTPTLTLTRYADFLDLCTALTGRAPHAGAHLAAARAPALEVRVAAEVAARADELLYPALGYACGLRADVRVPLVTGLEGLSPTQVVVEW